MFTGKFGLGEIALTKARGTLKTIDHDGVDAFVFLPVGSEVEIVRVGPYKTIWGMRDYKVKDATGQCWSCYEEQLAKKEEPDDPALSRFMNKIKDLCNKKQTNPDKIKESA